LSYINKPGHKSIILWPLHAVGVTRLTALGRYDISLVYYWFTTSERSESSGGAGGYYPRVRWVTNLMTTGLYRLNFFTYTLRTIKKDIGAAQ